MNASFKGYPDHRPRVAYFARKNSLDKAIIKELLKSDCKVDLISEKENIDYWTNFLDHYKSEYPTNLLSNSSDELFKEKMSYVVYSGLFNNHIEKEKFVDKSFLSAIELAEKASKSIFLMPILVNADYKRFCDKLVEKGGNLSIVFTPETLGLREETFGLTNLILKDIENFVLWLPEKETDIFISSSDSVARLVVRHLLSFTSKNDTISIKPKGTSAAKIISFMNSKVRDLKQKTYKTGTLITQKGKQEVFIKSDYRKIFKVFASFESKPDIKYQKAADTARSRKDLLNTKALKKKNRERIKLKLVKEKRWVRSAMAASLGFFLLPYFFVAISSILILFTDVLLKSNSLLLSKQTVKISSNLLQANSVYSNLLNKMPVIGKVFYPSVKTGGLLKVFALTQAGQIEVKGISRSILKGIFEGSDLDIERMSDRLVAEDDFLYKNVSFLQSEMASFPYKIERTVFNTTSLGEIAKNKQLLLYKEAFHSQLPELLGYRGSKTYMVLFFDNRTLRGAGGIVSAFGLVTIEEAKIKSVEFFNTKETDALLNGEIEPPAPLSKHLLKKRWFLYDVAWDPDYYYTAQKAEWFLEKEKERSVDGVIAFDLAFLFLLDEKQNPLAFYDTQISRSYLSKLEGKDGEEILKGSYFNLKTLVEGQDDLINLALRQKSLQLFFHNNTAQRSVLDLGWGGFIYGSKEDCFENCFIDKMSIIEDNFGQNSSSLNLKTTAQVEIELGEGLVKRHLALLLENESENTYKSYLRVLVPADAGISKIQVIKSDKREDVVPELAGLRGRKEAGVYVEIEGGEKAVLVVTWESESKLDLEDRGNYTFVWNKQAGKSPYDASIVYRLPENLKPEEGQDFFLTESGGYGYNTSLSRDVVSRIFWVEK